MSATVPPPLPPTAAAAATPATAAARGTVLTLPANASLAQGQALAAQVVSSSAGQLVLTTQLGRVTVQSTAQFTPGTAILLQVQSVGETTQVSLHLQHGTTTPHSAALPSAGTATGGAAQQPAAPVTTHLTEGSIVQATVTRGAVPAAPSGAPAPAGATPLPSAALPPAAAIPGAAVPAAAPAATPLVNGANLTLRVVAVAPPGRELPPAPATGATGGARLIAATVSAHHPGGAPVVTAGTAEIVLANAPALPAGSRLLLEVLGLRAPAGDTLRPLLPASAGRWEALNDAYALLQRVDPALARQVAGGIVPSPGPRLAGSMLFFLSAVFSGDARRFLGNEAMRQISRASGGAGNRLAAEIGQMQRTATDATGQDWRLFLVPIMTDEGLEQLRFMLRKNNGKRKKGKDDTGTRFMIEVTMSRLGPFQFDGLSRKNQLDLVVRTQTELPAEIRDEIRSIFGNTVTALGLTGTIAFRAVPKFDISPVEQPAERYRDLTV
jgi:hypothetical protein